MEREFTVLVYDSMTGVTTTLIPYDKIRTHGEFIYNLSLPFIPPLRTNNCNYRHDLSVPLSF
jgi:hypothetical protein